MFRERLVGCCFRALQQSLLDPSRALEMKRGVCRRGGRAGRILKLPLTSSFASGVTLHGERAGKGSVLLGKSGNAGPEGGMFSTWHRDGRLALYDGGLGECNYRGITMQCNRRFRSDSCIVKSFFINAYVIKYQIQILIRYNASIHFRKFHFKGVSLV